MCLSDPRLENWSSWLWRLASRHQTTSDNHNISIEEPIMHANTTSTMPKGDTHTLHGSNGSPKGCQSRGEKQDHLPGKRNVLEYN